MKELIALFQKHITDTRAKVNAALEAAPPIDQVEGAQGFLCLLNSMKWVISDLESIEKQFPDFSAALTSALEKAAADKIDTEVAAATLIRATDHALAIDNAKKEGEQIAATRFEEEKKEAQAAAARRAEIVTIHGEPVAAALPEIIFAAEAFTDAAKAEIKRRVDALGEVGVTAAEKPEAFGEYISASAFDADGTAAFDKRFATLKTVLGPVATATIAAEKKKTIPGATPDITTPAATPGEKKAFACF